MGNGDSGDQGDLPSYGKRDVRTPSDRKQHDWSELARAPNGNTLSPGGNAYTYTFDFCSFLSVAYTLNKLFAVFDSASA